MTRARPAGDRQRGGAASFVRTDVRVDGDVEHMVAFAEERHGGVDILVNNAGGWGPTANYPYASPLQWGSTLDLNLRAPMLATQLVLEPMRRRGGGAVVNVVLDRRGRPRALRVARVRRRQGRPHPLHGVHGLRARGDRRARQLRRPGLDRDRPRPWASWPR